MLTVVQPKADRRLNVHVYCNFHCNSVVRANLFSVHGSPVSCQILSGR